MAERQGVYTELGPHQVGEGRMLKDLASQMRRVFNQIREYERDTDATGKGGVRLQIDYARVKNTKDQYELTWSIDIRVPKRKSIAIATQKNGRLLCPPTGAGDGDPDQLVMFNAKGEPIAGVDPETGEDYAEAKDHIAGEVKPAKQA